jgi:hypothetical protein
LFNCFVFRSLSRPSLTLNLDSAGTAQFSLYTDLCIL